METVVLVVHALVSVGVIGFILIQQGKGANAGASFGAGASQTVFGSQGSANFISRITAVLATVFFVTSLGLAIMAREKADSVSGVGIPEIAVEEPALGDSPISSKEGESIDDLGSPTVESTSVENKEETQ